MQPKTFSIYAATIAVLSMGAIVLALSTGCDMPKQPGPPNGPASPFIDPAIFPGVPSVNPVPNWQPANPYAPPYCPPNCPGPRCPVNGVGLGREIDNGSSAAPVDQLAAAEPKRAGPRAIANGRSTTRNSPRPLNPADYGIRLNPGETLVHVGPSRPMQNPATVGPRTMPKPSAGPNGSCPNGKCPNVTKPNQTTAGPTPLEETKQGRFACQRCGRSVVGDQWHEVWADDDTPLTCLCQTCWAAITPAERMAQLKAYAGGAIVGDLSPVVMDAIKEAAHK
jgi:hypothetical protein